MQTLTQPTLLLKPFAESGDKNTIPTTNTDVSNPQRADLTNGFPSITSETPDNGGLPPERKDFNGLGYLTTTYDFFYQAGGQYTFNSTISTAIGGYPQGARLWYTDSNGNTVVVRSLIQNNTYDFVSNPSYIDGTKWTIDIPSLASNNVWTGSATFSGAVTISGNITSSGTNSFSGQNTFTGNSYISSLTLLKQDNNVEGGEILFEGANNEPNYGKLCFIDRNSGHLRIGGFDSNNVAHIPLDIDIQNNSVVANGATVFNNDSTIVDHTIYGKSSSNLVSADGMTMKFVGYDGNGHWWNYIDMYRRGTSQRSETWLYSVNNSGTTAGLGVICRDDGSSFIEGTSGIKASIANFGMPNYSSGVSKSFNTSYSETSNGYLFVNVQEGRSSTISLTIGGVNVATFGTYQGSGAYRCWVIPVPAGNSYYLSLAGSFESSSITFYPCIGG